MCKGVRWWKGDGDLRCWCAFGKCLWGSSTGANYKVLEVDRKILQYSLYYFLYCRFIDNNDLNSSLMAQNNYSVILNAKWNISKKIKWITVIVTQISLYIVPCWVTCSFCILWIFNTFLLSLTLIIIKIFMKIDCTSITLAVRPSSNYFRCIFLKNFWTERFRI